MSGENYGTMDFWVRLRVPMDQAIRLYRVSIKRITIPNNYCLVFSWRSPEYYGKFLRLLFIISILQISHFVLFAGFQKLKK